MQLAGLQKTVTMTIDKCIHGCRYLLVYHGIKDTETKYEVM